MSHSGTPPPYPGTPYAGTPYAGMPLPRRPGRKGPPLWLGIVVTLLGPAVFFATMMMIGLPIATALTEDLVPAANGQPVTLAEGGDYFVMSPALADTTAPCVLKRPGAAPVILEEPPPSSGSEGAFDHQGEPYTMRGYFPLESGGQIKVTCPQAGDHLLLFQWPGGIQRTIKVAAIGTVAAGVLFVAGVLMILLRRRHPVW